MELVVTEVTEMQSGNYCVATWDVTRNLMVRPLPDGANWSTPLLTRHQIAPGVRINVTASGNATGSFPHLTEDTPIQAGSITVIGQGFGQVVPALATNLQDGFDGHLEWNKVWQQTRQSPYVLPNTDCKSLIGVEIDRDSLTLSQPFEKLKATLNDGSASYELAVSSHALKEAWREGGVAAATATIPNRRLQARFGLARPVGNPSKCYLMLNGLL